MFNLLGVLFLLTGDILIIIISSLLSILLIRILFLLIIFKKWHKFLLFFVSFKPKSKYQNQECYDNDSGHYNNE